MKVGIDIYESVGGGCSEGFCWFIKETFCSDVGFSFIKDTFYSEFYWSSISATFYYYKTPYSSKLCIAISFLGGITFLGY